MRHQKNTSQPEGLRLVPEFLSQREEADLLLELKRLQFTPVYFIGAISRRELCHFGWEYAVTSRRLRPAPPIPEFMLALRGRCAREAGLSAERFTQVITTHYPPGAGIGEHVDAPVFGETVLDVSLSSPCRMLFKRDGASFPLTLKPRSLLILTGPSRSVWMHAIPGSSVKSQRYSITMRSVA
ncbi:MAG TPA: alpha-ketoglutarate-dependent dioxygenase AlkB [Blastocatellia bacterium]|nr:alpha-ketoglutarate-dependent dioxygenase AlkB [Blastocatellia bacterium]